MVYISKVEIFGFKSFGFNNTIINFEPGLISISGPNGSGKSNILDAIIFAFGENRPKIMRVDKISSLIHDIDKIRSGTKLARVSVHLYNKDKKIPIESNNVVITRELHINGDNTYYLNKKKINRTKILDFLDITNTNLNQLNAIQQGTVTRISEFSPDEKRTAIENLVGLSFFDEKKNSALKQLDDADRRLEIALARMNEIKKRIDELEEERNLKLRYDLINHELDELNNIIILNKLHEIKNDLVSKQCNYDTVTLKINQLKGKYDQAKKELTELNKMKISFMEQTHDNNIKNSIDSELGNAIQKFEEINSAITVTNKRLNHIERKLPNIISNIKELTSNRNNLKLTITNIKNFIINIKRNKKLLDEHTIIINNKITCFTKYQTIVNIKRIKAYNKIHYLKNKLGTVSLNYNVLESRYDDLKNKLHINNCKKLEFSKQLEKINELRYKLMLIIAYHKKNINGIKSNIRNLQLADSSLYNSINELKHIIARADSVAYKYEIKTKLLKKILHEDYTFTKITESQINKFGIIGIVHNLFSWNTEYHRSVLASCSNLLNVVVVKDFGIFFDLIELIHKENLPRMKIISIDMITDNYTSIPQDGNIIGTLANFINCDKKLDQLKKFLFGNIILTNSQKSAQNLSQLGYKAVTKSGVYFDTNIVIIDNNSKVFNLEKIIEVDASTSSLKKYTNLLKEFVNKKNLTIKKNKILQHHYESKLINYKIGLTSTLTNYSDLKSKITIVTSTLNQLILRMDELEQKKLQQKNKINMQHIIIESLSKHISRIQRYNIDLMHDKIANILSDLNEKKLLYVIDQNRLMNIFGEKNVEHAVAVSNMDISKSKIYNIVEEEKLHSTDKIELDTKLINLKNEKQIANDKLIKLREKEQNILSKSISSVFKLKEFDKQMSNLNEKIQLTMKEINRLERTKDSLIRDIKELEKNKSNMENSLKVVDYIESEIEIFNIEPIIYALNMEKNCLQINTKAPNTYREISYGYRSMSDRKNELEEERNSIVNFIEMIEKDKRQTFLNAFDKVDKEISLIFSKIKIGNAWLELQNEDDVFSSGISYMIQFNNKPKRESSSVSGGEKTLSAIVFVLALQKLKPSPFYLFDEIDAHLDAVNSEKLAQIIEERSNGNQFIMVSLKDSLVQKAKLIYGVYPRNGVSKLVAYRDGRLPSTITD